MIINPEFFITNFLESNENFQKTYQYCTKLYLNATFETKSVVPSPTYTYFVLVPDSLDHVLQSAKSLASSGVVGVLIRMETESKSLD